MSGAAHPLEETSLLQRLIGHPPPDQPVFAAQVITNTGGGDFFDQEAVHLGKVHQLGNQAPYRLRARFRRGQDPLDVGVFQHGGGHRAAF
ncbi:hypothetical protein [Arthrobacter sp. ATA002]|uniref:hypothetical protein n=1 Tax=Arthrobacter sp. ATA002 TaxID=2991715 RepID=UPI002E31870D|nr:hypothetical protein [Arthrobacter sp. ATA002]